MSNAKVVMGQAANTLAKPLNVEDVFSTYLYEGNGSTQTITNGIDLDGEGGLVWIKSRNNSTYANSPNVLTDSVTGFSNYLISSQSTQQQSWGVDAPVPSSTGFSLPINSNVPYTNYLTGSTYASWTFRKAPKFFDVVTYTGDGVAGREIAHDLGSTPGCIVIKRTDTTANWQVTHRGTTNPMKDYLYLNLTGSVYGTNSFFAVSDSTFTLSNGSTHNASGGTYVAYLFAHNDGDGGFNGGDIIKCGSYTGNGSTDGPEIDLGFEPQWVMIKSSTSADNWNMYDSMRGVTGSSSDPRLVADQPNAEITGFEGPQFNATGFKMEGQYISNASGQNYIYIAIRRGTKVPESGTEVFSVSTRNASEPAYTSGFPVDFAFARAKNIANNWDTGSRLQQGNRMFTNLTNAEASNSNMMFDYQDGWSAGTGASTEYLSWMWKRAPGYFDVVAYTGDGVAGRTVSHNLGVAPEMMWVKKRSGGTARPWYVYHKGNLNQGAGNGAAYGFNLLNTTDAYTDADYAWNETEPSSSSFTLGNIGTNDSGNTYIAYLFASLPNVSKCGSYTGNGTSQNIDCGFTSGARFVLIKVTSTVDNWFMWDTLRGISVGPDSYLRLDITNAETDGNDRLDPYSGGFAVRTNDTSVNKSGESYIFYAIA